MQSKQELGIDFLCLPKKSWRSYEYRPQKTFLGRGNIRDRENLLTKGTWTGWGGMTTHGGGGMAS